MPAGGKRGNKGGGRSGHGLEVKQVELKGMLLLAVLDDCKKNPARQMFWAEKFAGKLLPNDLGLPGNSGSISIKWE